MPNSILWIGLVVLWVFVLFPILADRHPRIRQTTDAALATRVLHRGGSKRRTKKGPAAGHDSDPDYRPTRVQRRLANSDDAEDRMTKPADEPVTEADDETTVSAQAPEIPADATDSPETETGAELIEDEKALDAAEVAETEAEASDPDDEDDELAAEAAEPPAESRISADDDDVAADLPDDDRDAAEPARVRIPPTRSAAPARIADDYDDYDDYESDSDDEGFVPSRRGRGGYDPEADAIARAARYTFRQRAVLGLILSALLFGGLGVAVMHLLWWGSGLSGLVLITYLAYLRKQVRMEEDIRRRRAARLSSARQRGETDAPRRAERTPDRGTMDRDTARALRRRSVLIETDDEDPMFEHLDTFDAAAARAVRHRAAGGDIRRAAGA
ncbi:gephyrin-like molybdotransferase receptor GlpR [Nocardia sp. NPDC052566]|uniref:divisome protein SepX/GlpR n=1 Tax=Nocardia sp. NPDC052566 TaxID=3364330 RepID=UPI0037CB2A28